MLEWLLGMGNPAWNPEQGMQAPHMPAADMALTLKALALHPDAPPEFNLQPTIEMLRTAELYGFDVVKHS